MALWRSSKGTEVDVDFLIDLEERLAPYHVDLDDLAGAPDDDRRDQSVTARQ